MNNSGIADDKKAEAIQELQEQCFWRRKPMHSEEVEHSK